MIATYLEWAQGFNLLLVGWPVFTPMLAALFRGPFALLTQRLITAVVSALPNPYRKPLTWLATCAQCLGCILILPAALHAQFVTAGGQRPMTVEDLFTLRAIAGVAVSPDGNLIAASVVREGSTSRFGCILCNYQTLADVWVVDRRTGTHRDVTRGTADSSGSWLPAWSPSGRRLALVSSKPTRGEPKGGDNVRVHVWDRERNALTRVSDRGIYLQADIQMPGDTRQEYTWLNRAVAWLDDNTLLAVVLPPSERADEQVLSWRKPVGTATRAWERWARGTEPTASILESGKVGTLPQVELHRIDVVRGTSRTIARIPKWDLLDLNARLQVEISPDRRHAAIVAIDGTIAHRPERRLIGEITTHAVGWVSLDGTGTTTWADLSRWPDAAGGQLLGWSPDGRSFAIQQQIEPWLRPLQRMAVVVPVDGRPAWGTPATFIVDTIAFAGNGELLAYARRLTTDSLGVRRATRWDWWRVNDNAEMENLTARLESAPDRLHRTSSGTHFVGIADGAVWRIDSRGPAMRFTEPSLPPSATIAWSSAEGGRVELLAQSRSGASRPLFRITLADGAGAATIAPVRLPTASAVLADLDESGRTLVFIDEHSNGLDLWSTDGLGEQPLRGLALNEHVASIAQGKRVLFSYRGAEGDSLQGLAVLPPDYDSARRYPVVVWVYGGLVIRDTTNTRLGKNYAGTFNLEVLAGRGYVVLFPSMPLPFGIKSDVWAETPKGVLPAVDKLVELGIADPTKLAVMGHSFGGFSTYAIITQTNRFRAAVAMSGHPDLISLYGQFLPAERYSDRAHESLVTASISEYGPFNMGGSLWQDLWHYQRNSPLFYFDRVTTPLMIVHGDLDGAPIQQGEEAFTALNRLGKRARFVRYWGEGHVVGSPVNVRHLWSQIFDWLDSNLGITPGAP